MSTDALASGIEQLQGPILILGASGFVGANLLRHILVRRSDVFGTTSQTSAWRLEGVPGEHVIAGDLLIDQNLSELLDRVRPRTVFNCIAYGAYSFEDDASLIYRTNVEMTARVMEQLRGRGVHRYVHAGSSSEYGEDAAGPSEDAVLRPNSHYSVSKGSAAGLIHYAGRKLGFPGVNLRLYSVYGPYEDASRLVPTAVLDGLEGHHASYVDPETSRDFVYVDDACEAFICAALNLKPERFGDSYNIGSGVKTTIGEFASTCSLLFGLEGEPGFTMAGRKWDTADWFADPVRAQQQLGWRARTSLAAGLERTAAWCRALEDRARYRRTSKKFGADEVFSVSAIVACYKDAQAIPFMHQRLSETFRKLDIGYEIIFINDNSPDDSEDVIRAISARDRHVIGVSHARNFGSQAAFRSGLEIATKNACVLLDGDLQDPPELIEAFVAKWREGYEVVYGRRVKRDAPWHMGLAYKLFYRLFQAFSYVTVPRDAGDFSLMDRRVVRSLLSFPERDLFLRGVRAFVGFRQVGVDYVRPERMFGVSTNNLMKNIGWAKKGILSFSNVPLMVVSTAGILLFALSVLLGALYVLSRLVFPAAAPRGFTSTILIVIFFGSINMLGISILGEYIAKIFEEVKRRPHFVRRNFIRDGEVRLASETGYVAAVQRI
ncbi:NAD-dependent epimerase/dehydratase family protein [Caulobacter sp. S45]|uniref:NAD-dependent epimerase/dehydratase family protein n=1 Tax=Caulobacter sp. S45 TaxID=1641861 RepID=UPI001576F56E|nr:NAD-dependent epimerase/dehydratase family protein [Caulobacter sp. S45]